MSTLIRHSVVIYSESDKICCSQLFAIIFDHLQYLKLTLTLCFQLCFATGGLTDTIPDELFYDTGIDQQAFKEFFNVRLRQVEAYRQNNCRFRSEILLCLLFGVIPGVACCWCNRNKKEVVKWSEELDAWQHELNATLLAPNGCYAKSQSKCVIYVTGDGKKKRAIERWIAIAMNPQDSEALKMEPHLFGDIQDLSLFMGPNENQLVANYVRLEDLT